jgi:dihydrofolate reductase
MIVGMTKDRVIGKENTLPWPIIVEDMKHFRKTTTGHIIIMGRKTYDSIGKPLPKRINVVITRQKDLEIDGCWVVHSLEDALKLTKHFMNRPGIEEEAFIIGGASLYKEAAPLTDRIYLTHIKGEYEGDTFFPELDTSQWNRTQTNETDKATFYLLERNNNVST